MLVVTEHPVFATYRYYWMNQRFSSLTIEKLLANVKGIDVEVSYTLLNLQVSCILLTLEVSYTLLTLEVHTFLPH